MVLEGDTNPGAGEKIPYNRVITNVGNGYITARNEFVCPTAGLYVFYFAGYGRNNADCYLDIVKNDAEVGVRGYAHQEYRSTGTNMAVLELDQADLVYIRNLSSGCQLWGTANFNAFSGFKIV